MWRANSTSGGMASFPSIRWGLRAIWAAFLPGMQAERLYKFGVTQQDGRVVYKTDPYALFVEHRPGVGAVTWRLDDYTWRDKEWMDTRRAQGVPLNRPVSIYEVHAGSWRRRDMTPGGGFLTYRELADQLIPYAKDLGFTHIQFMPLAEHPLDESWG